MQPHEEALALGAQLLISAGLVLVMVIIHATGLLAIGKMLHLDPDVLRRRTVDFKAIVTMAGLGTLLFALHIFEILMFAVFYIAIGAFGQLEDALFFSASAYTTLGLTANFPEAWRLLGAVEALIGFVLIGWSTAYIISTLDKIRD
ncbi:ion channel [Sphingomonas mesophila]|uniref:ion channel n=1 Tax=Sphingomonas mesophila TaxID=2303576 RepID=UPI000E577D9D|nr:ion channel [Sphingomonas mesophila]